MLRRQGDIYLYLCDPLFENWNYVHGLPFIRQSPLLYRTLEIKVKICAISFENSLRKYAGISSGSMAL